MAERRSRLPQSVQELTSQSLNDHQKLKDIFDCLKQPDLDPIQAAQLRLEGFWLQKKLEIMKPSNWQSSYERYLNKLEKEHPEIYAYLSQSVMTVKVGHRTFDITRMIEIRNKVLGSKIK